MPKPSPWVALAESHRAACGRRLAAARMKAGLTLTALTELVDIPEDVLARYETDTMPSTARMYLIAHTLGVGPEDIWGFRE